MSLLITLIWINCLEIASALRSSTTCYTLSSQLRFFTEQSLIPKMRKLKNEELERLDVEGFKQAKKTPLVIVLDNIRSLNNIGSVFRTADAFLIEKIYLCGITATPPHKDIRKTALGATESVEWEYRKSTLQLVERLKSEGYTVLAIEQAENAQMLHEFKIEPQKNMP